MDLAVAESQTEVEKYLRESGGFTYAELREIAAVAIQV